MNTTASRRIFVANRKPAKPFGALVFLVFAATLSHVAAFTVGAWMQGQTEPKVVYVPIKTPHPLQAWNCTGTERNEYLRACFGRARSEKTRP